MNSPAEQQTGTQPEQGNTILPNIFVPRYSVAPDFASILGLILTFILISSAILMGNSDANFFDLPSVLMVILGTLTATAISCENSEIKGSVRLILSAFIRTIRNMPLLVTAMIDFAVIARKKGVLALSSYEHEIAKDPALEKTLRLVIDGFSEADIARVLQLELDAQTERSKNAAAMLRRASEIAPAMGLIGTLVGLVQMLANLENPDTIGPAMAIALLTTFYGAILGSVILSPLAAKLEKNAANDLLVKTMAMKTALSIARQENPRNLEMVLNGDLPPSQRISYFD